MKPVMATRVMRESTSSVIGEWRLAPLPELEEELELELELELGVGVELEL